MAIWFTSDHHFGHKNIIKYENRPFFNVQEMNRVMLERWNEVVAPDDTVYYLGDLQFGKPADLLELVPKLNGKKTLVRGNHDRGSDIFIRAGFEHVILDKTTIDIGGRPVILCHYPYKPKAGEDTGEYELKYMDRRPDNKGQWLIHGHVHGTWKIKERMICVAVENWDYYPVHIDTIRDIINK